MIPFPRPPMDGIMIRKKRVFATMTTTYTAGIGLCILQPIEEFVFRQFDAFLVLSVRSNVSNVNIGLVIWISYAVCCTNAI